MRRALDLAAVAAEAGEVPVGAVITLGDEIIAEARNSMRSSLDPTAHAELLAIREACRRLGTPRLDGSVMHASGHPCPMCLAAMHLCGVAEVHFAYSNEDGEPFGLSTATVYAQMALPPGEQSLPVRQSRPMGEAGLYEEWVASRPG